MTLLVLLEIPQAQVISVPTQIFLANFLKQPFRGLSYMAQCNLSKEENRNMFPEYSWC